MKKLLLILLVVVLSGKLLAQGGGAPGRTRAQPQVLALPFREVSGVVKDTSDNTIIGATITLTSKSDTLRASTNSDGIFVIKNVKQAVFVLTVKELGYLPITRKYLNNDAIKRVVLEPIIMHSASHMMNEVKINGVPSITYKPDTVEYRASDYKVHANATVDELLKKMEGMEVGSDGTLTHQGQQVMKARLNGKDYAGGNVAQAIQNLPADIVEKIQIVDDYGDAAARTGIKDGDPQKVLNITTRADRSVGTTGRLTGQYGSDDRYNAQLFVQRINANQQLGVIGRLQNTVNGVASTGVAGGATNGGGGGAGVGAGSRGGSSGTTKFGQPSFNYRDQWSKKVQVIASYSYNFRDNHSLNTSYGQNFTSIGPNNFTNNNTSDNNSTGHNINFQMEITPDSADFIQITPTFSYSSSLNSSTADQDNIDNYTTGFQHNVNTGFNSSTTSAPNWAATVFYQHLFKKPHRNISLTGTVSRTNSQSNGDNNSTIHYYTDSTTNHLIADSISHYQTNRTSVNTTYRAGITYVEPFSLTSQLEFTTQFRSSVYNNTSITDTVLSNGQARELTYRDNISDYSFTETRATLNYHFNGVKYNLAVGATAVPSLLSGTKVNNATGQNVATQRSDFRIIPVFRFAYSWSRTQRFTIGYSGSNTEPTFTEIQPFTDISNKQHYYIGNPNLSPAFTHSITAQYNNYIANSKFNMSFNLNGTFNSAEINQDNVTVQLPTTVNSKGESVRTNRTDTYYINIDGAHAYVGRYNFAKQLDDRKYSLSLNGNITYNYGVGMSGNQDLNGNLTNIPYHTTNWRYDERFGPRINPNDNIEINPYVGYDVSRTFTSLSTIGSNPANIVKTTSLAVDGKMYFLKTWNVNYSITKSYVTGLGGLSTNPTVINAGFEKEFFQKKNFILTFNAYDLLHQNNFVQQNITTSSITNTQSNSLSRYFLIGFRLNLQKWSGVPTRNGKQMMRRGDGSFIY
jgi:hypothetical protein